MDKRKQVLFSKSITNSETTTTALVTSKINLASITPRNPSTSRFGPTDRTDRSISRSKVKLSPSSFKNASERTMMVKGKEALSSRSSISVRGDNCVTKKALIIVPTTSSSNYQYSPTTSQTHLDHNFRLIWLHSDVIKSNTDYTHAISKLRQVIDTIDIFTSSEKCIEFLNTKTDDILFLIVSNDLAHSTIPLIHDMFQIHCIFIFCESKPKYKEWTKSWEKVEGFFTCIASICETLEKEIQQYHHDSPTISVTSVDLIQLDPSFVWGQLLKEIFLDMQFDVKSNKEFIQLYRQKYRVDNSVIDEFEHHYDMHTPIWWYTQHACLSDMINQAFRLQDINISIKAGFLIQDLHKQIEKLYKPSSEKLILYRGQRLTYAHVEQLRTMQDGLFSFNSFLSTSIDQNVALYHADCSRHDSDRIGVVFEIKIDPMAVIFTPFCSLDNNSDLKREFLFTMFTIFRIGEMKQLEDRLWHVELSLTSDNDHDVKQLTNYIHQTTQGSTGWDRLGKLLLKMGHFDKAENVFQTLIANSAKTDFKGLGHRYHQMGLVKKNTGLYKKAIIFYNKAIKMYQTSTYSNYSDFSTIHNDIGSLYQYTEEYTEALESYQIAVDIEKESNPVNYSNLAIIYDNIAEVNKNMKQYSTALQFYKIVLKIHRTCIPLNFQKLSTAYRKIAEMRFNMEEYPEALRLFQKIFHIQQYSLPPNYIDTATIENNIGQVYERMGEHSKASEHYRNAFKCYQPVLDVLLESHTQNIADLAIIYNNIAAIHMNMKDFGKALEFYKKTLEILKKFPHVKKPDLAATYDNIGQVYQNMYDYSNAFLLYSKATRVARESSPVNPSQVRLYKTHLEVAIGKIGDYSRMVISKETRELIDMV